MTAPDPARTRRRIGELLVSLVVSHLKQSGERMKETTKETAAPAEDRPGGTKTVPAKDAAANANAAYGD